MQLVATFARPMSWRQSSMESRRRVSRGSEWRKVLEPVVRRTVLARRMFLAQRREVSDSRRWALARIDRNRWRQPRS